MPNKLEDKLTAKNTYKMARETGFGRVTSAYFALPIVLQKLTPTTSKIEVDKKAKTYHLAEPSAVFGKHVVQPYALILELKGYKKI